MAYEVDKFDVLTWWVVNFFFWHHFNIKSKKTQPSSSSHPTKTQQILSSSHHHASRQVHPKPCAYQSQLFLCVASCHQIYPPHTPCVFLLLHMTLTNRVITELTFRTNLSTVENLEDGYRTKNKEDEVENTK